MIKKALGLLFLFCLVSCGINFDSYMPNDQGTIKNFPPELMGRYDFSDSTLGAKSDILFYNKAYFYHTLKGHDSLSFITGSMQINNKNVVYHYALEVYYNISKFDTAKLIEKFKEKKRYMDGNYMVFVEAMDDTLLNLGLKDKLTSLDGKLYFNHQVEKKYWEIYQFEKIKGSSYSINLTNGTDRKQLTDTTKEWQDIFPVAHLSNQQFRDFVTRGGFRQKFGLIKSE